MLGGGGGDLGFVDEYPALPDCEELDEDELNEETFGTDLPSEEWDLHDLASQTQHISAIDSTNAHQSARSVGMDMGGSERPGPGGDVWEDHQAWLEESISNLVDDDDMGPPAPPIHPPPSHALPIPHPSIFKHNPAPPSGKDLTDLFLVGSPQTPFFDMAIASTAAAIWGPQANVENQRPIPVPAPNIKARQESVERERPAVNGKSAQETPPEREDEKSREEPEMDIEFGSFTDLSSNSDRKSESESLPASAPEPLRALLAQMQVQHNQDTKTPETEGHGIKGAKTLEEIEAEMRGPKPKVMSLEELERHILASDTHEKTRTAPDHNNPQHPPASTQQQLAIQQHLLKLQREAAILAAAQHQQQPSQHQGPARMSPSSFLGPQTGGVSPGGNGTVPPPPGLPQGLPPGLDPRMFPRFPQGHPMAGMPMPLLPPHMMPGMGGPQGGAASLPPIPSIPPALLMNPQFRNALAAHLASGKPLPPGLNPAILSSILFRSPLLAQRMPPPPPGLGLPPRGPGGDMRNSRPPPPSAPFLNRMPDPHMQSQQMANGGAKVQQRRLFDSGNGQFPGVRGGRNTTDPFNGLMGRKERDWLVKISSMQLQSENPYQDDYYFTMLRNRQLAKESKDTDTLPRKDSVDTPYVYVPPKFEGSLGKVQFLSANFPRQLIDLRKEDSTEEEDSSTASPRGTPTEGDSLLTKRATPGSSTMRQFKVLLMEVENLWTLLLDCEEHQRQLLAAPEEAKTGIQFAVKVRVGEIAERLGGDRLPLVACIRKGKHLIARGMGLMDKEQTVGVLQDLCKHMSQIVRKDMNEEALDVMFPSISQCIIRLGKEHMAQVLEKLSPSAVKRAFAAKNKFVYSFTLLLLCQCSRKGVELGVEGRGVVREWASSLLQAPVGVFPTPDWVKGDHVRTLSVWLAKEIHMDEELCGKLGAKLAPNE